MVKSLATRTLGKSGINVSVIGTGLWAVGGGWGPVDDKNALAAIDASLDAGINFFDTADVYGDGHSEELLGKAMHGRRERFVVATKIGWVGYDGKNNRSQYDSVDKLVAGVEQSLRRLQTDHIDVIQNHIFYREPNTDIFIEGFQKLQRNGKVRAYGLSTSDFAFIKDFNTNGECATLQIDYSILNRTAEQEIFPYCQKNNIGVIVRGALAMGILTGKFTPKTRFADGDFRQNWHEKPDERRVFLEDLDKVNRMRSLTDGRTLAQLALRFVIDHPAVTTVIPGARSAEQARENVKAGLLSPLTKAEHQQIDAITSPAGGRKIWPA
ncbi:MAG TPA: aldo/keto reductase [Verrucomicrobiae bacterium]|nr:aldo/keto reductase [Verrucomicrobiae bacterium]